MVNLYWSVYRNLEREILVLSSQIHFDDEQLSIYSVKISELLLRCSVEIESLAKELYINLGGSEPNNRDLYFDTDCLELLEQNWKIGKKKVLVSAANFYFQKDENRVLTPLYKANKRGASGSDWKKAYQAVKHNRVLNLKSGNLKNLIRALAALYILNIYFKGEVFDLKKDALATNFPANLGSEIFSIKLHRWTSYDQNDNYTKSADFDECIYITKWNSESETKVNDEQKIINRKQIEFLIQQPKFLEWLKNNKLDDFTNKNIFSEIGHDLEIEMMRHSYKDSMAVYNTIAYEAVLNNLH